RPPDPHRPEGGEFHRQNQHDQPSLDVAQTLLSAAPRFVSAFLAREEGRDESRPCRQECLRHIKVNSTARPTAISAYVSGSGMVGTVDGDAGSSPFSAYCAAVSSTTAPVRGVTT